ncbi:DUF6498-containing protein [Winogradskyella ursingii]|uniref:DUF6498-containing protein n=1 Tax=Winogradskyella ursingii TaxID=2686079 RepID=UPI0015C7E0C5|nr:DUF6498-containing protein [Winogradskyella ursingii]
MKVKRYILAETMSLIALSILTLVAINSKQITIFYVLYLFWMDEMFKTIFDFIKFLYKRKRIAYPSLYNRLIRSRFFMLCVYLVFIVVFFGFILDWKTEDAILSDFEILMFQNPIFNLTVLSFLIREIYLFYSDDITIQLPPHHILSKGIITLHLSIVLGVFIWALFNGKLGSFRLDLGIYSTLIAVIPFLIIKLIFEVMEMRLRLNQSKALKAY